MFQSIINADDNFDKWLISFKKKAESEGISIKTINKIKKSIISLGSFDGFHLCHLKIITKLISISQKKSIPTVIMTFDPHPKSILKKQRLKNYTLQ